MELYILKSVSCLALFFAFYKVFLERTSIHNFKRFYLFGILILSFVVPLITFTIYVDVAPTLTSFTAKNLQIVASESQEATNYWPYILWSIYGLGVLFFSLKFYRNLFTLIQKIRQNPKYRKKHFINILLKETVIPHTFFSYIFLNKLQFENDEIPREVILHEQAHAIQKHSLDILFVEFLQIIFWFNPLFYFIKRSIKLNHEFLADQAVLKAGTETSAYQKILLAFSSNAHTPALAHSINYSSIKKRFTVMKTHTSKRSIWFRSFLILPLLSLLIFGFSSQEIVQKQVEKTKEAKEPIQKTASKAELSEYNKLAKKYNEMAKNNMVVKKKDLERLHYLYGLMTLEQKRVAEPYPNIPPPPAPEPPKVKKGEKSNIPPPPPPPAPKAPKAPSAENGNLYMAAEAPPAPNPDPVEYIKELGKRGATFYIGPHKYSTDEAVELVRKSKEATIDVSKYPEVHLGGC